ncbi:ABC transporter ATP-binding protein [Cloacibacillus porcorum]|uniref:ABC transporter ATP-binding protein n=1 Tax=Cloacibacillus porcorum TaxID=1197717 RepID=UPI0014596D07|nr:ABC transporter ATP-binding protein [Cloacibacillus porcorum]MCC8185483.1 ABC transporter ATP-binding protein [Cloacibacillus porcorum]MDY5391022.1 ABC transporter ATP-binding protein [Cloacibacillus porcorum]NMF18945.1 ABC transporter ATP-binding protein [Cloacibacillus porcorum]
MAKRILRVENLKTTFFTDEGVIPAVDNVSFHLDEKETLAIVGESGCGKTVTSLSILRLIPYPPGKITDGRIYYSDRDLLSLSEKEMRAIRGNDISMIFQEPMTSLNPVFTVGAQIMESLIVHQNMSKADARKRAIEMIRLVGIPAPEKCVDYYPHQLSGGMRQRIMIAMALACRPKILIADEPTTALDVTVQAQILRLMIELKEKTGTAIILITHDLGIVAQIADRVNVMYAGETVESADVRSIFREPLHPYTVGLLKSLPKINEERDKLYNIKGAVPSPKNYPQGCRFSPRCERAAEKCRSQKPGLFAVGEGRCVRCWLYEDKEGKGVKNDG